MYTEVIKQVMNEPCWPLCIQPCVFSFTASNAAKREVPVECGVRYGPKEGQMLDVFGGQSLPHGNCNKQDQFSSLLCSSPPLSSYLLSVFLYLLSFLPLSSLLITYPLCPLRSSPVFSPLFCCLLFLPSVIFSCPLVSVLVFSVKTMLFLLWCSNS